MDCMAAGKIISEKGNCTTLSSNFKIYWVMLAILIKADKDSSEIEKSLLLREYAKEQNIEARKEAEILDSREAYCS